MKSKIGMVLDVDFKPFNPIDRSVYGHVLTNYGSQWNLNGRSFDGIDDYVDINNLEDDIQNLAVGTISVWVKIGTSGVSQIIFSASDASDVNGWITLYYHSSGNWWAAVYENNVEKYNTGFSTPIVALNTWYHLALVQNGTAPVLYVNGIRYDMDAGEPDYTAWFNSVSDIDTVSIGSYVANNVRSLYMNGTVDKVLIWNRVLSAPEVQQLYLEGKKKGRV